MTKRKVRKQNMYKKVLSMFLLVTMFTGSLPIPAFAEMVEGINNLEEISYTSDGEDSYEEVLQNEDTDEVLDYVYVEGLGYIHSTEYHDVEIDEDGMITINPILGEVEPLENDSEEEARVVQTGDFEFDDFSMRLMAGNHPGSIVRDHGINAAWGNSFVSDVSSATSADVNAGFWDFQFNMSMYIPGQGWRTPTGTPREFGGQTNAFFGGPGHNDNRFEPQPARHNRQLTIAQVHFNSGTGGASVTAGRGMDRVGGFLRNSGSAGNFLIGGAQTAATTLSGRAIPSSNFSNLARAQEFLYGSNIHNGRHRFDIIVFGGADGHGGNSSPAGWWHNFGHTNNTGNNATSIQNAINHMPQFTEHMHRFLDSGRGMLFTTGMIGAASGTGRNNNPTLGGTAGLNFGANHMSYAIALSGRAGAINTNAIGGGVTTSTSVSATVATSTHSGNSLVRFGHTPWHTIGSSTMGLGSSVITSAQETQFTTFLGGQRLPEPATLSDSLLGPTGSVLMFPNRIAPNSTVTLPSSTDSGHVNAMAVSGQVWSRFGSGASWNAAGNAPSAFTMATVNGAANAGIWRNGNIWMNFSGETITLNQNRRPIERPAGIYQTNAELSTFRNTAIWHWPARGGNNADTGGYGINAASRNARGPLVINALYQIAQTTAEPRVDVLTAFDWSRPERANYEAMLTPQHNEAGALIGANISISAEDTGTLYRAYVTARDVRQRAAFVMGAGNPYPESATFRSDVKEIYVKTGIRGFFVQVSNSPISNYNTIPRVGGGNAGAQTTPNANLDFVSRNGWQWINANDGAINFNQSFGAGITMDSHIHIVAIDNAGNVGEMFSSSLSALQFGFDITVNPPLPGVEFEVINVTANPNVPIIGDWYTDSNGFSEMRGDFLIDRSYVIIAHPPEGSLFSPGIGFGTITADNTI
ncbi:MAG: hypothetical protein FWE02_06945, partial [Defluviitaleaceae bacterium]|nr:hypothetical protein [Defluviitaleaceae bacterium]